MNLIKQNSKNTLVLAAAITGLLSATAVATTAHAGEGEKVKCYGANACKGQGACGGVGHSCAGKNACKGQGYVETETKDACLKLEGGRLTADKK